MPFIPGPASTTGEQVDLLFTWLNALAAFFVVLIAGLVVYFSIRYRRRSEDEVPEQSTGGLWLEVVWTVIPLGLALGTFFWAAQLYLHLVTPPPDTLDIYVVGKQWMWQVEHPGGQQEINELHVPVGRPVKLTLISQDVIHSFFVPEFRIKQDALPQRYTTMWFEATRAGRYHLFCAEYCGSDHSRMTGWVIAMEPDEYQQWLAGGPTQSPAALGGQLFQQYGCAGCHRTDAQQRAPSLTGVYGQPVQLQSGETVSADENYLRESILDPQAKVVAGFQPIMPSFRGQLSEQQILRLIAYIRSLGGQPAGTPGINTPGAGTAAPQPATPEGTQRP